MEFRSAEAEDRYAAFVAAAAGAVVGLDFDGVLSPIVDDPTEAHIHPDAGAVLADVAGVVSTVAVITGRPARQALALGRLDEVADALTGSGKDLRLFGQYGFERWSSGQRRIVSPRPPQGLATFLGRLPGVLRRHDAGDAFIEEKGLAVAVHTRRLDDPRGAFERLLPVLEELAGELGLKVEPGRHVIEVRSPGMDKGRVVRALVEELDAGAFLFAGDDLGDLPAFEAVAELREAGMPTLLVYSRSEEQDALLDRADVVVDGPDGVLALLSRITRDVRQSG